MTKKIFILSIIIFLIIGTFLFAQFFLLKEKKSSQENNTESGPSVLLENKDDKIKASSVEEKIKKIVEGGIKDPFLSVSGNRILYFNQSNFLSTSLDGGEKTTLGAYPFNKIEEIVWSSDNKNAIVRDSGVYYLFDVTKSIAKPFKAGADNLIWGKIENQLVYKFYDSATKKRSLNISDLLGEKWQEIAEVPFQYAEIKLNPKNETVALFSKPSAAEETKLFLVNLLNKEKKEMAIKYKGADYEWSPDGEKLLFSYTKDTKKSNIAILNIKNDKITELNFPGLVDKCVWSKDSIEIYCAALAIIDPNAVIPDDWKSGKIFSSDTFWKINTNNGEQKRLFELKETNEDVDAISLFLDNDEKYLFFVDRKSGDLFRIDL